MGSDVTVFLGDFDLPFLRGEGASSEWIDGGTPVAFGLDFLLGLSRVDLGLTDFIVVFLFFLGDYLLLSDSKALVSDKNDRSAS